MLKTAVGSIICATAISSPMFIAGRATSGTGAAGIINGAMRIIGVSSPRKERIFLEAAGTLVMGKFGSTQVAIMLLSDTKW